MNIYETHTMEDPQLPFIFHKSMKHTPSQTFRPSNWHENVEIIYVTQGKGIVTVDTKPLAVKENETVVINPNCMHKFEAVDGTFGYHCLIVDRAFCNANYFDTNRILFDPHFEDPTVGNLFCALAEEYPIKTAASPYRTQIIRATVLQIMARLCRHHSTLAEEQPVDSYLLSCIKQAIGYIRAHCDRDLSLDGVSAFVGLSKFYFAREFRRITGYTFVDYVNMTRCEKAKTLLAENRMSVGEVGHACGFDNQSYFSRTFRAYTGVLPSAYRKK